MKIAVLVEHNYLDKSDNLKKVNVNLAYIFYVTDNKLVEHEYKILESFNKNYLLSWILDHRIDEIYAKNIDKRMTQCLRELNIFIKSLEKTKDHPIINRFLKVIH